MASSFATIIRDARLAAGLTLRQVGDACEVTPAYICDLEQERRSPSPALVTRLAPVLGCEVDALYAAAQLIPPDLVDYLRASPAAIRFLRTLWHAQPDAVLLDEIGRMITDEVMHEERG